MNYWKAKADEYRVALEFAKDIITVPSAPIQTEGQ